jgi:hypothetical protein
MQIRKKGDEIKKNIFSSETGSFQQSLAEIGSVVSEEKIFFYFIPPFFVIS